MEEHVTDATVTFTRVSGVMTMHDKLQNTGSFKDLEVSKNYENILEHFLTL